MNKIIKQTIKFMQRGERSEKEIRLYIKYKLLERGINKNDFIDYLVKENALILLNILGYYEF